LWRRYLPDSPRTLAAWSVVADCEVALEMLDDEETSAKWRVLWVGSVSLLRAIGHVLKNVDRRHEPARSLIDNAFRAWKEQPSAHRIFWDFIKIERDKVLKEYEFCLDSRDSVPLIVDDGVFLVRDNLFRPVASGYGNGEDARDVYGEALGWWKAELTNIEHKISEALAR